MKCDLCKSDPNSWKWFEIRSLHMHLSLDTSASHSNRADQLNPNRYEQNRKRTSQTTTTSMWSRSEVHAPLQDLV